MKYWFIFCKTDLLLEKKEDGTYTIPCSEESPIPTKPWTHILNITPMEDGTEVKTFTIPEPVTGNPKYEMCGLRPNFYKLSPAPYFEPQSGSLNSVITFEAIKSPALEGTKAQPAASTNSLLPFTRKQESVRNSTIGT